jgi:hypothetical protein
MYLIVSSDDCKDLYPDNNIWDFTVELPIPLVTKNYRAALTGVYFKKRVTKGSFCVVFSDICEESVYSGTQKRILGTFFQPGNIENPPYLNLLGDWVKRIRFKVQLCEVETYPDSDQSIFFVIHLQEK